MFKGQGEFKQQAYNHILVQVPIVMASELFNLIVSPFFAQSANPAQASIIRLALTSGFGLLVGIEAIVLNIFAIMATHRLSGGKATLVVLIPYAVLIGIVALCACTLVVIGVVAAMNMHN
jgi:hypothetical protein